MFFGLSIVTSTLHPVYLAQLLVALELDEAFDFLLRMGAECPELVQDRIDSIVLVEKVTDGEIEALQNLEQCVETDLVLALFHPREVGLVDADFLGKLHLRQLALAAELPDFPADEF
jgi:hypothetical protein